jgi:hypothetical protein
VNVIYGAIDRQGWGIQLSEDRAHVGIEFFVDLGGKEGLAILGAKDQLNEDRRKRLGHSENLKDYCAPLGLKVEEGF